MYDENEETENNDFVTQVMMLLKIMITKMVTTNFLKISFSIQDPDIRWYGPFMTQDMTTAVKVLSNNYWDFKCVTQINTAVPIQYWYIRQPNATMSVSLL